MILHVYYIDDILNGKYINKFHCSFLRKEVSQKHN